MVGVGGPSDHRHRLTIFLLVELVTDQLPKTPSRKTPPQFITRLLMGAFAGAVIGSASHPHLHRAGRRHDRRGAGHAGRRGSAQRLTAANGGKDRPVAIGEDIVAVGGGFLIAFLVSSLPRLSRFHGREVRRDHRRRGSGRPAAGRQADRSRTDRRGDRTQTGRRHLRQHRLYPDQDAGGQRARRAPGASWQPNTASAQAKSRSTWRR